MQRIQLLRGDSARRPHLVVQSIVVMVPDLRLELLRHCFRPCHSMQRLSAYHPRRKLAQRRPASRLDSWIVSVAQNQSKRSHSRALYAPTRSLHSQSTGHSSLSQGGSVIYLLVKWRFTSQQLLVCRRDYPHLEGGERKKHFC